MAQVLKPLATYPAGIVAPGIENVAETNPLTLPQGTTKTIFTVTGGPIDVMKIFGICTTVVPAVANATKLQVVISVAGSPVTTDICATVDITGMTVGSIFELVTSSSTTAVISTVGFYPLASATLYYRFTMNAGSIQVNCAGSDGGTGMIQWFMHYRPMSVGLLNAGMVQITAPLS